MMLNVFNLKVLNKYNYEKAINLPRSNYRERINSQIRDKIKKSSIAKKINDNTALKKVIDDYLRSKVTINPKEKNEVLNDVISSKKEIYSADEIDVSKDLETLIDEIVEEYYVPFCCKNLIKCAITDNNMEEFDLGDAEAIKCWLKKLAVLYLFFEYNEKETSLIKYLESKNEFEKNEDYIGRVDIKKIIEKKSNGTVILPFLRQHFSESNADHKPSLVIDNQECFGDLSGEMLLRYFKSPIDIDPYNYKYWGQTAAHNNRNTYAASKFLEFMNCFCDLIKDNNQIIEAELQEEILELVFNFNYIVYNAFGSPLKWYSNSYAENYQTDITNWVCRFFYHSAIIPMPEYRIYLSGVFNKKCHTEIYFRSKGEHHTHEVDIFNANVERIAKSLIPTFLKAIDYIAYKKYADQAEEINKELQNIWNNIVQKREKLPENFTVCKLFKVNDSKEFVPNLSECALQKIFEDEKINVRKEITENYKAENAFSHLHELIYSAQYYNREEIKFLAGENGVEPLHKGAQIDNSLILDPVSDFYKFCCQNKDKYECLRNISEF